MKARLVWLLELEDEYVLDPDFDEVIIFDQQWNGEPLCDAFKGAPAVESERHFVDHCPPKHVRDAVVIAITLPRVRFLENTGASK